MGLCVALETNGTLTPTGQSAADCTGYMLVTPSDYAQLSTLDALFSMPDPTTAAAYFTWINVSIIGAFVLGRMCAKPVNVMK